MHKDKIKLKIITPERIVVNTYYDEILLPSESGLFELLPNHENFISKLKVGVILINIENNFTPSFIISQSFLKFSHNTNICEIMAEYAYSILETKNLSKDELIRKIEHSNFKSEKQFYQFMMEYIDQKK